MNVGGAFPRQGNFPKEKLDTSLALLEQRTADRFDFLSKKGADLVGDWIALSGLGLDGSTLGNGRITGQWRLVGASNAGFRLLIEVGTTTVFGGFGFGLRPPPGYSFDTSKALFTLNSGLAYFPVTMAGLIGAANTGAVLPALMTTDGTVLILGAALALLAAADVALFEVELPVKVTR